MKYFENVANEIVRQYIIANYTQIKVIPGKCRFNYRCQANAVHDAIENGEDKISMAVYIDDVEPIIHFLQYKKGKYIDNTLGHWSAIYKYYHIKFIDKGEFWDSSKIFRAYRKYLRKMVPWYVRVFLPEIMF